MVPKECIIISAGDLIVHKEELLVLVSRHHGSTCPLQHRPKHDVSPDRKSQCPA
jgi:hypothetical protein